MRRYIIKDIRNDIRLAKENKAIKYITFRDIRKLFDHGKEDFYKPVSVCTFQRRNYIEYESNEDRNKTLSIEEYLRKIRSCFKDIIDDI